jgi:light-regulated signal transduction histidine kinase (bacteriophytochrome)
MKAGALDYILKPFKMSAMQPVLDRALAVRRLRQDNAILSQRVSERTAELEAANKELDAFTHSVSHDLRAPLRHIQGFAGILAERFAAQIPPEAQRHLGIIVSGAKRMEQLIEDLLRFSRTGRQPLSSHVIDMNSMADGLIAEMKREITDRAITWKVGDLPPCQGDPSLLRQVWVNLLSNAVKFTAKRNPAEIEVGSEPGEGGHTYFVRDNGAGFDMQQADKLFGVFQRMHRQEDFQGTGVGLSIVQRIIVRHGGRIWVQSEVDAGTTFYFFMPAAGPPPSQV